MKLKLSPIDQVNLKKLIYDFSIINPYITDIKHDISTMEPTNLARNLGMKITSIENTINFHFYGRYRYVSTKPNYALHNTLVSISMYYDYTLTLEHLKYGGAFTENLASPYIALVNNIVTLLCDKDYTYSNNVLNYKLKPSLLDALNLPTYFDFIIIPLKDVKKQLEESTF